MLARLCSLESWDGNSLHPIALQLDDLRKPERGWSVQRTECTDLNLARQVAASLGLDWKTATVAAAATSEVRGILTESGEQGLFVIENCVSGNHAHALVFAERGMKR